MTTSENLTTNTSTTPISWTGGDGTLAGSGNFSSGTLRLQFSTDGGTTWIDAKDADAANLALTENGALSFSIAPCQMRASLSGAIAQTGSAQVETLTIIPFPSTYAQASFTVYAVPVANDQIRFTSPAGIQTTFTFVTGAAGAGQISLSGLNTTTLVAAAIAARTITGLTETSSGPVVTIVPSAPGTAGNGWAMESVGAWAQRIAVTTGGRDAGTLAASGIVNATITSALIPSSPIVIDVPVEAGDTLNVWVGKVRQRLIDHPLVSKFYTIGGSDDSISLSTKSPFPANDATLNIAIASSSPSLGFVTYPTSTNTAAGVATTPAILTTINYR